MAIHFISLSSRCRYSVSGTLAQSPLVQSCVVNSDTVTVILAVVIPVCAGVALLLVVVGVVLVVLHRRRTQALKHQEAIVDDLAPVGMPGGGEGELGTLDLDTALGIQVPRPSVQYYRNPAAQFGFEGF